MGKANIPNLKQNEHYVRAERKVTTFILDKNGEAVEKVKVEVTDRLFYEVFITSDEVKTWLGVIDNKVKQLPVLLRLQKKNALIKFHLELAFEWDADAQTRDFWIQALRHASTLLYDVTDGHACIGSVKVLNNHRYSTPQGKPTGVPRNAIQVFANNDVRPYVYFYFGAHFGRKWLSSIVGDWREIQPELLGSALAHEFGHSLLLLPDEYDYETGTPLCVEGEIGGDRREDPTSSIACLMASPWDVDKESKVIVTVGDSQQSLAEAWFKASELCNGRPGRHTYPKEKDCWTNFKDNFSDKQEPKRWLIITPVDREMDVVVGPALVRSYTKKSTRGRLIEVKVEKDDIGKEMQVDLSQWQYGGGRKVEVQLVKKMVIKLPMNAYIGIFPSPPDRWIYQGRTDKGKIKIEGYHDGEIVEIFTVDRFMLVTLPNDTSYYEVEVYPQSYSNICQVSLYVTKGYELPIQVTVDPQVSLKDVYVQMVVQGNKVLDIRDVPLEKTDKNIWKGSVILDSNLEKRGFLRLTARRGGHVIARASFGEYKLGQYPIAGDTHTIRLANGLGLLKAPEATPDTTVSFVATTPFVFGQGELIPRSFAYSFKVTSGNLGNNAKLELSFDPIQQLPEGRTLNLYQFSEQEQKWQPTENAQIIPEEGRVILSPPVEGTFALMETALPPPAITLPPKAYRWSAYPSNHPEQPHRKCLDWHLRL